MAILTEWLLADKAGADRKYHSFPHPAATLFLAIWCAKKSVFKVADALRDPKEAKENRVHDGALLRKLICWSNDNGHKELSKLIKILISRKISQGKPRECRDTVDDAGEEGKGDLTATEGSDAEYLAREKESVEAQLASCFLGAYVFVVLAARCKQGGVTSLYDFVWACNVAMIIGTVALWKRRFDVLSAVICSVSIDQLLWYIDIIGFLVKRKFVIGVAEYLTWSDVSLTKKLTATHHIWFIPLCTYVARHRGGFDFGRGWMLSAVLNTVLMVVSRAMIPYEIQSKQLLNGGTTSEPPLHMNINLTHECWKDIKIQSLHVCDQKGPMKMLPFLATIWNTASGPFFAAAAAVSKGVAWSLSGK